MSEPLKGTRIGWIGIGRMGHPMVARLLRAGHAVQIWNRTRAKAAPLAGLGARIVDRPHDLAGVDVLFTMVSTGADLEQVLFGAEGAASAANAPRIVVDCSSIGVREGEAFRTRLGERGVRVEECGPDAIRFDDPSGLRIELVAGNDRRAPWSGAGIDAAMAVRGLHSVTMVVRSLGHTRELMTGLLGYRVVDESQNRTRFAAGGDAPGHTIDVVVDPDADAAINGIGTVHHVAMAISNGDEQRRLRDELLQMGLRVTDIRDRCYFESIYFNDPNGYPIEITWQVRPFSEADALDAKLTVDAAIALENESGDGKPFGSIEPVWQRKAATIGTAAQAAGKASVFVLDVPEFGALIDVAGKTEGYTTTALGNGYVRIDGNPGISFRRKALGFKPAVWYGALTGGLAGRIEQFDMDALVISPGDTQ